MHTVAADTIIDGRYRAVRRLGAGGMAEVWCAEDSVLGRRVALKLLSTRFADDAEFRERFRREARAAASFQHPNIVGVFDFGEWDGTPYIAMELVEGRTLKDLVRERGPLPPATAVAVMEQILQALGYAHKRGVVHRDIKPQNVIIDEEGRAKVADFGIARAGASEMTETGTIIGTVQYIAPEQAEGRRVDARSDLYSAGIVLYELLTGRVPFDGEAAVPIAIQQINEPPVPPGQLQPGLPRGLEAVVMRALEKDPALRFASADEFIAALHAPSAPPPPPVYEPAYVAEEEPESHWWVWLLALLLILALAVGAYFLLAGKRVDVPNVVGQKTTEAADTLHRHRLEVAFRTVVSDRVPRDEVISQDPAAGDRVKEHTTVEVTVSAGRGSAPVPHVQGLRRADAEDAVREAGFAVDVKRAYSDTVPSGTVISSSPPEGETLERGRTVTLTVSRGPQGVAVPKLTGLQRSAAEQQLSGAGLQPEVTEQESGQTAGTVLAQDPAPGTRVDKGAAVKLTVAKERPRVPDVSTGNPTIEEATATLEQAGYKARTRDQPAPTPDLEGHVLRQYPPPGTSRSTGATITLVVGTSAATPTPTPTETATP